LSLFLNDFSEQSKYKEHKKITGMKPQSKLWKQIRKLAEGYYTLRFAGLFDLQISIHFVFEI
jgi:hypothetical protein